MRCALREGKGRRGKRQTGQTGTSLREGNGRVPGARAARPQGHTRTTDPNVRSTSAKSAKGGGGDAARDERAGGHIGKRRSNVI